MPTTDFSPDANPESTSVDGYVERVGGGTWADIRDGAGTSGSDGSTVMRIGMQSTNVTGPVINQWTAMQRAILLFDTSSLGAGATVSSAELRMKRNGNNVLKQHAGQVIGMVSSSPASDTAVASSDYDSGDFGTTLNSNEVAVDGQTRNATIVYALNATGVSAIDTTGITKFALRLGSDRGDAEPTKPAGVAYTRCEYYQADSVGNEPVLRVTYTITTQTATIPSAIFGRTRATFTPNARLKHSVAPSIFGRTRGVFTPAIYSGIVPSLFGRTRGVFAPTVTPGANKLLPSLFGRIRFGVDSGPSAGGTGGGNPDTEYGPSLPPRVRLKPRMTTPLTWATNVYQLKQDSVGSWVTLLRKAGSEPVDLTNADGVTFYLRSEATDALKVTAAACTIIKAVDGEVSWPYTASDTDTAGRFKAEFHVDWGGGSLDIIDSKEGKTIDITDNVAT